MFATSDDITLSTKSRHVTQFRGIIRLKPATSPSLTHAHLGILRPAFLAIHLHAPAVMLNVLGQARREAAETYEQKIQALTSTYMVN